MAPGAPPLRLCIRSCGWRWIQVCCAGRPDATRALRNGEQLLVKFPAKQSTIFFPFTIAFMENFSVCGNCKNAMCLFKEGILGSGCDEQFCLVFIFVNIRGRVGAQNRSSSCNIVLIAAGGQTWCLRSPWPHRWDRQKCPH